MCGNLLDDVQSGYSYGIGEDAWGCQIARERAIPVHQYDCFDKRRPKCRGAVTIFHDECVAGRPKTDGQRRFDTISRQISRNGDVGKRLVVKIDIEGAEWSSLLATPDSVLQRIDQLAIEFHGTTSPRYVAALRKLKRTFDPVHVHFNNFACSNKDWPFPASAFQVLFVNKRIAVVDRDHAATLSATPLDAPDAPALPDCQLGPGAPARRR